MASGGPPVQFCLFFLARNRLSSFLCAPSYTPRSYEERERRSSTHPGYDFDPSTPPPAWQRRPATVTSLPSGSTSQHQFAAGVPGRLWLIMIMFSETVSDAVSRSWGGHPGRTVGHGRLRSLAAPAASRAGPSLASEAGRRPGPGPAAGPPPAYLYTRTGAFRVK